MLHGRFPALGGLSRPCQTCQLEISALPKGTNAQGENSQLLTQSMARQLRRQTVLRALLSSPVAFCRLIFFIPGFEIQCHSSLFVLLSYGEPTVVFLTVQTLN